MFEIVKFNNKQILSFAPFMAFNKFNF